MKKIISTKFLRIIKNKKRLEEELKVNITNRGTEVYIDGKPEKEFIAEKVIEALNFGFPYSHALDLKNGEAIFEIINIKEHTSRKDLNRIKARIIGKAGKTIKTLSNLTNCYIEIKDNFVGIIGDPELIKKAQEAIISLIQGSKQGNVYARLEKQQYKEPIDLGLKE